MAIVPDLHRFPCLDFNRLSVYPDEHRKEALEDEILLPNSEQQMLMDLRLQFEEQLNQKIHNRLSHGIHEDESVKKLITVCNNYHSKIEQLLKQFPQYVSRISRRKISIAPPAPPNGKHALGHTFPAFTAAMWSIWPGDSREHRAFLESHNAKYRTFESAGSKGVVFVTPPRLPKEELIKLLEFANECHPYWRNPPTVSLADTRKDVRTLLNHYEEDFTAVVLDDGGKFIGTVNKELMEQSSDHELVANFIERRPSAELPINTDPQDAYVYMLDKGAHFVLNFEQNKPLMMTRKTAAASKLTPPFKHNDGLGCMVYVGVDDFEETAKILRTIMPLKPAGIMVESAHIHRTDIIYNTLARVRELLPDLFIATGTTSNPKGVLELARFADAVKTGIANGSYCETKNTGVELPDAYVNLECSAAAKGVVSIIADNLSNSRRYSKIVTLDECIGAQGGGSFIARRDSSNKLINREGKLGKIGNGEASLNAVWRNLSKQNPQEMSVEQRMQKELGLHSEGVSDRWTELRDPPTFAEFISQLGSHARSMISYAGFNSLQETQEKVVLKVVDPID